MKKYSWILLIAFAAGLRAAEVPKTNSPAADSPRQILPLDQDWRFHLGEVPDGATVMLNGRLAGADPHKGLQELLVRAGAHPNFLQRCVSSGDENYSLR